MIQGENKPGTTVNPLASVSVAGIGSSYAAADHRHAGFLFAGFGNGGMALSAGSGVTISLITAAGVTTVSFIGAGDTGSTLSTSTFYLGPDYIHSTIAGGIGGFSASSIMSFTPFTISCKMTVSKLDSIMFARTMASSGAQTVSGANTMAMALYSIDTANSSYVMMVSGSLSLSHSLDSTGVTSSSFFSGTRSTSFALNTSTTLSPTLTYVLAMANTLAGSGGLTMVGFANSGTKLDNAVWGVSSSPNVDLVYGVPNGTLASSSAFITSIGYTSIVADTSNQSVFFVGLA